VSKTPEYRKLRHAGKAFFPTLNVLVRSIHQVRATHVSSRARYGLNGRQGLYSSV
jgi:hypothetical protein